jgi:hypothetical protein
MLALVWLLLHGDEGWIERNKEHFVVKDMIDGDKWS